MLKKLIKYDFRALSRILVPVQIAVLGAAVIATGSLAYLVRTGDNVEGVGATILFMILTFLMVVTIICIGASSLISLIVVGKRYYDGCLQDEGYLTFTLPVTPAQVLWSKFITGGLWMLINMAVIFLSALLVVVLGTGMGGWFDSRFLAEFGEVFKQLPAEFSRYTDMSIWLFVMEFVLAFLVSLAQQVLQIYFAITAGGMLSHKHKLLTAIGVYMGVNIVVGMVSSVFSSLMSLRLMGLGNELESATMRIFGSYFSGVMWVQIGLAAALCVGFFLLTNHMFTKKLNLE